MNWFWDEAVPYIQVGGAGHFTYIIFLIIVFSIVFWNREKFSGRESGVYLVFGVLGLIHQLMITSWYIFETGYDLRDAMPLHICRVVVWFIIFQGVVRQRWMHDLIFYFGLYAYGSFALPIAIHPPHHFVGWTFVLLHTVIIIYPFIIHWMTGWVPASKGAIRSFGAFLVYFAVILAVNALVDGNYFYMDDRPFLHRMPELPYIILNIAGTFGIFMIGLMLSKILLKFEKQSYPTE